MNADHDLDQRLDAALRALPREQAGAGFKDGVLRRLQGEGAATPVAGGKVIAFGRRSVRERLPLWLSVAAALLALVAGGREWQHRREQDEAMRRIAELRARYETLAENLEELRGQAAAARPVVYLAGNDQVDLVLDLRHLADDPKTSTSNQQDPAVRKQMAVELAKLIQEGRSGELY